MEAVGQVPPRAKRAIRMDKGTKGFPQNLPFNSRRGVKCICYRLVLVLLLKTVLLVISFRKLIFNNKRCMKLMQNAPNDANLNLERS